MESVLERAPDPRRDHLVTANLLLVVLLVVHTMDHTFRQDAPVPAPAAALGLTGLGVSIAVLALALAGSRLAAPATALVGFATAVGFAAIHLAPDWGPVSQFYPDIPADAVSWVAMVTPLIGAFVVGMAGLRAARSRRRMTL